MAEANENTPLLGAAGGAARQVPQTLFLSCIVFVFLFCLVRRQVFFNFHCRFVFRVGIRSGEFHLSNLKKPCPVRQTRKSPFYKLFSY